jgi:hypothetical protein
MPQKKTNGRQFSVRVYDSRQRANLSRRLEKVLRLIDDAAKKAARIGAGTPYTDTDEDFRFDNFPKARREIDALLVELSGGLTANAEEALSEAWDLANAKNDAMVDAAIATAGASLPKKVTGPWYNHNERALGAFMRRVGAGMNLSEDVWNLRQFKGELELALEMGLGRGKSAAELSRDVRSFLKYPDKLFRRVRDEKGVLRLSRAAQEFHPGQGVYRSSYKNALRLTATETNMAYRTADNLRWKKSPFVIGQTIEPSRTNHPVVDICDELKGDYPKDFVFTGWHPFCRCFAVPKECTDDEMFEYFDAVERGEDVSNWHFKGEVNDVPGNFKDWMQENEERISRAKSLPYFIKDNPKYNGMADVSTSAEPTPVSKTPQEIAAERHAARTKQEEDDIRQRWESRWSEEARDYFANKRAWTHTAEYVLEEERDSILTGGKIRPCRIYKTSGGTQIVVPKNLNKKYQTIQLDDLVTKLEKLPVELKALTKRIELLDYYNPADAYWRKKYKNFTRSFATGGRGTIAFYRCQSVSQKEISDHLYGTLAHENGHNLDHLQKRKGKSLLDISEQKDWKVAMATDLKHSGKESPLEYGKNALTEDFAVSCQVLVTLTPEVFKKEFPGRYAVLKRLLRL